LEGLSDVCNEEYLPRELVRMALNHKETPRVPFALGWRINLPPKLALMDYLGHAHSRQTDAYLARFQDIIGIDVPYIGPAHRNCRFPDGRQTDIWGVIRAPVSYAENGVYNEICHYPLAEARTITDLDAFEWPDPGWYDYNALPDVIKK